jgi:hypothetical protein
MWTCILLFKEPTALFGRDQMSEGKIGIHRTQQTVADYMANLEEETAGPFEVIAAWREDANRAFGNEEWFGELVNDMAHELLVQLRFEYRVSQVPQDDGWMRVPGEHLPFALATVYASMRDRMGPPDGNDDETERDSVNSSNRNTNSDSLVGGRPRRRRRSQRKAKSRRRQRRRTLRKRT